MSADGRTEVRRAGVADATVAAGIHMTSRAATMPYLPPLERDHNRVTRWVEDVMLRTCRMWMAVRGTEILGYAALAGDMLEHLCLHVFQQNTGARAFYEHHGFTVLDTSDGRRNMENPPDMTLRWAPNSAP